VLPFGILAALSFTLTFGRVSQTGIDLDAHCKKFPLYATAYPSLNSFLNPVFCPLAEFFAVLFKLPEGLKFSTYVSAISLPVLLLPIFEAYRSAQSKLLKYPILWFLVCQWGTMGAVFPLYWMTSILTGGPKLYRRRNAKLYTQAEAEALVFGLIAGAVIPTIALLKMYDPMVLAIWMLYPVIMAVTESAHLHFRPPHRYPESGIVTLRVLFFACFILASSAHIAVVWPLLKDLDQLKQFLLPAIVPLPASNDAALHYLDFLKWDLYFAHISTLLATFWFAENLQQVFAIALWYIFSIPVVGFGAALAGFAIWRNDFCKV
jgi:hypothetical protein